MRQSIFLLYSSMLLAYSLPMLPVPWDIIPPTTEAPTSLEAPPMGCTCLKDASPCTIYECACVCNKIAGACDPNCCCDSECTSSEIARFRELDSCLPDGPANMSITTCIDTTTDKRFAAINPHGRMVVERQPGMEAVLCISVDNNPTYGSYYSDPGQQDSTTLSRPDIAREYTYKAPTRTIVASTTAFYDVGARMPAAIEDSGVLRSFGAGYWAPLSSPLLSSAALSSPLLSSPVLSSPALSSPPLSFRFGEERRGAVISSAPLSAPLCEALSGTKSIRTLRVARSPASQLSDSVAWVGVTLGSVFQVDLNNGSLVRVDAASAGALIDAAAFASTVAGCSCTSAVVGLAYRVSYATADNTISSVAADVILADISHTATECAAGAAVNVPIATSIAFTPDTASRAAMSTSLAASNIVPGERSGNPGYDLGAPVLAGALVTYSYVVGTDTLEKKAVARAAPPAREPLLASAAANTTGLGTSTMGLYVRGGDNRGRCVAVPTVSAALDTVLVVDAASSVPVTFGDDAIVSCDLELNPTTFATACAASPADMLAYFGLGTVDPTGTGLASTFGARVPFTHVGVFGNADPLKYWQWMRIDAPASPPASATYDGATVSCQGVLSGLDIEFLTARVGELHNPQRKIVAVRARYTTDTWRYSREDVRTPANVAAAGTTQRFTLRTTVTWTEMNAVSQDWIPPVPPVIPPLPSDLFYPFITTAEGSDQSNIVSAGHAAHLSGLGAALAAVIVCLLARN